MAVDPARIRQIAQRQVGEELAALKARRLGMGQEESVRQQLDEKRSQLLGERLFELEVKERKIDQIQLRAFYKQYCGHFFDFERIFVRLKFVSDYLATSFKFKYLFS